MTKRFHDRPILAWLKYLPAPAGVFRRDILRELELFVEYEVARRRVFEIEREITDLRNRCTEDALHGYTSGQIADARATALAASKFKETT